MADDDNGKVHLDYAEVGRILREDMAGPVRDAAERVAREAAGSERADGGTVTTKSFRTDRAVTTVMFAHPAAGAIEAKYGLLTRAAASTGLEVKSK